MPAKAFSTAPEPTGSVAPVLWPNVIDTILDALTDKIAALAKGIEALLANQSRPESGPRQSVDVQGEVERCCFCGSIAHLDDECEEVVKYILAGKCKCNVFGKLTLPSGAKVPRSIRGRNLLQCFDKYHQQYPGQQATPGYLETLARVQRPAPQSTRSATPPAIEVTTPSSEARLLTIPEAPEPPQYPPVPTRPQHIPQTAANQSADLQTPDRPRHVTDLQGPPSERTQTEKLRDLKKLAQHYTRDRGSCDDVQISYLESLEERDNDNLRLAQMISR
jgi:hypothetical protein